MWSRLSAAPFGCACRLCLSPKSSGFAARPRCTSAPSICAIRSRLVAAPVGGVGRGRVTAVAPPEADAHAPGTPPRVPPAGAAGAGLAPVLRPSGAGGVSTEVSAAGETDDAGIGPAPFAQPTRAARGAGFGGAVATAASEAGSAGSATVGTMIAPPRADAPTDARTAVRSERLGASALSGCTVWLHSSAADSAIPGRDEHVELPPVP